MPNSELKPPRVLISYSYDSQRHLDNVLNLSDRLRSEGVDCWIDQYEEVPPDSWPAWMNAQVASADFVLVVCTPIYRDRFEAGAGGAGGAGKREGMIITRSHLANPGGSATFVPIVFSESDRGHIPSALRSTSCHNAGDRTEYEDLYRLLTNQPAVPPPPLGSRRTLLRKSRAQQFDPVLSVGDASVVPELNAVQGTKQEWDEITRFLTGEVAPKAYEIGQLKRYKGSKRRQSVHPGIRAVLRSLSYEDAEVLYDSENLDEFIRLMDQLQKDCIERLRSGGRRDVGQAFRMAIDQFWNGSRRKLRIAIFAICALGLSATAGALMSVSVYLAVAAAAVALTFALLMFLLLFSRR